MRLALILATIAAPAMASDSAMFGGTGCKLVLTPGEAHVARVDCRNVLEGGSPLNEGAMIVDGLTVGLVILHGAGDIPDRFSFTAPVGYMIDPPEFDLGEGKKGVALVYEWVGS